MRRLLSLLTDVLYPPRDESGAFQERPMREWLLGVALIAVPAALIAIYLNRSWLF